MKDFSPGSPVFIVGCPRSGTSLLRDLLQSHPNLAFPDESRFIPAYYLAYGDPRSDEEARRLGRTLLRFPWVQRLLPELSPTDFEGCRSYREIVDRLFRTWAEKEGKRRWGDKTPLYLLKMPIILEIFPDARFLHIIRDGRDVTLSFLRAPFGPSNVYRSARYWSGLVRCGRSSGSSLPVGTYHEIMYETLVTRPEETLCEICQFIDEPFDPVVLQPSRRTMDGTGRTPKPVSWNRVRPNIAKWKTEMKPDDIALFESVAGDLLEELGYEIQHQGREKQIPKARRLWWEAQDWLIRSLNLVRSSNHLQNYLLLRWARIRARMPVIRSGS